MKVKAVRQASWRIAAGCLAALALTFAAFHLHCNLSSATSLHLFLISTIALRWGFVEAGIVSMLSVACLDFFFTEPLFTFYMASSRDWVALLTFEAAALLVSSLSGQVRLHTQAAKVHESRLQRLYELSQNILLLDRKANAGQQLADLLRGSMDAKGVALWNCYESQYFRSGVCQVSNAEIDRTYSMQIDEDSDDPETGFSRRVLRLGTRPIGALAVCGHAFDAASINAAASLSAIAMERAHSFAVEAESEASRQSEQLRSAILDGLAHAFKSPLTTIRGSSSGLLAMDTLSGTEKKLVALIDQHAGHLNDLTNHLLVTAKLDRSDLRIKRERLDLAEILRTGAEMVSQNIGGHAIEVRVHTPECLVWADGKLLPMALLQLLDNATKYSVTGSTITVDLQEEPSELVVVVRNMGSFIPAGEREKVFQRFYRSPASVHRASGTGLGLSVVKRIAEAHQGRTWVESDESTGTAFYLTLPRMAKEKDRWNSAVKY